MFSPKRKDNELLKAKRLSKAALAAFACAFAWAGCTIKTDAPQPAQQPRTIELSFAQIQDIQPEETPEVRPEPPAPVPAEQSKPKKAEPEKPKPKALEKPKPVKKLKEPKAEKGEPALQKASESAEAKAASQAAAEQVAKRKSITAMLVSLVEKHKRYPKAARRAGMEGVVLVEFTVDSSGKVTGASVIKKSGNGPLDSASQELSNRIIGTAFNVPNAGMKIQVPIRYSLD